MNRTMLKFQNSYFPGNEHIERQIISQQSSTLPRASSATKELDDLMASLSDFKVSPLLNCLRH